MAKNYGTPIGFVLLHSKYTEWRSDMDVLYRDDSVLVIRSWPNTPLPRYYVIARDLNTESWSTALKFMATLNTGGIQVSVLSGEIDNDFETVNKTFMSLDEAKKFNERIKAQFNKEK